MNIENLLKQILDNQIELKKDINEIKNDIKKVKQVIDHTVDLTEFITQTKQNFTDVNDTLKFLIHKQICINTTTTPSYFDCMSYCSFNSTRCSIKLICNRRI